MFSDIYVIGHASELEFRRMGASKIRHLTLCIVEPFAR